MAHPEHLYYAAMFLIALPMAALLRNAVALIVFTTWTVGQIAFLAGMPEPQTQAALYVVALVLGIRFANTEVCLFSAVLFVPLAMSSVADAMHWVSPLAAWWSIYWAAMLQVAALPFAVNWRALWRRHRVARNESGGVGDFYVAHR